MAFGPDMPWEEFLERVTSKFNRALDGLGMKFKDEDGGKVRDSALPTIDGALTRMGAGELARRDGLRTRHRDRAREREGQGGGQARDLVYRRVNVDALRCPLELPGIPSRGRIPIADHGLPSSPLRLYIYIYIHLLHPAQFAWSLGCFSVMSVSSCVHC